MTNRQTLSSSAPLLLRVGDAVLWRGTFGTDAPRRAIVTEIEQTTHPRIKYGAPVEAIAWRAVRDNFAVVTLDTGNWAYGEQLEPWPEQAPLPGAEQVRAQEVALPQFELPAQSFELTAPAESQPAQASLLAGWTTIDTSTEAAS